jgi:quercetin dioxygenase-like cupin family protein
MTKINVERRATFCLLAAMLFQVVISTTEAGDQQSAGKEYAYATRGVIEYPGVKLLLDESNLGGRELEMAEMTLPAGTVFPAHQHGSVEILYVLSGQLGHEVNGELHMLTPGMVGIVRPGDSVRHIVPKEAAARFLVIWAPAGEAKRMFDFGKGSPIKQN